MDVKTFFGEYEVVHSGLVHVSGDKLTLMISGLPLNILFISDGKGSRWEIGNAHPAFELRLFDLNGALPEGRIDPVAIASDDDGDILMTFLVSTIDSVRSFRSFEYTLLRRRSNS